MVADEFTEVSETRPLCVCTLTGVEGLDLENRIPIG